MKIVIAEPFHPAGIEVLKNQAIRVARPVEFRA